MNTEHDTHGFEFISGDLHWWDWGGHWAKEISPGIWYVIEARGTKEYPGWDGLQLKEIDLTELKRERLDTCNWLRDTYGADTDAKLAVELQTYGLGVKRDGGGWDDDDDPHKGLERFMRRNA